MRSDGMALLNDAPYEVGLSFGSRTDHEERGYRVVLAENLENGGRVDRVGAVIEGQRNDV